MWNFGSSIFWIFLFCSLLKVYLATQQTDPVNAIGDILLPENIENNTDAIRNSWVSNDENIWTYGEVFYVLDERYSEYWKEEIRYAFKTLNASLSEGCMEFKELNVVPGSPPYIQFLKQGCHSMVGKQKDQATQVFIGPHCNTEGQMIHEILHALGAAHEHNRPDRDIFVRVNMSNIREDFKRNFNITIQTNQTKETPYDYYSIMHYFKTAHAIDPNYPVLEPVLELEDNFLQYPNEGLSATDIVELSRIYNCPVRPEVQLEYVTYLDKLLCKLMDKINSCIDSMTQPDDSSCGPMLDASTGLLREGERMFENNLFHLHKIHHQQAVDKQNLRKENLRLEAEIRDLKIKHNEETAELKSNFEMLRLEVQEIKNRTIAPNPDPVISEELANKPWASLEGIRIFENHGYRLEQIVRIGNQGLHQCEFNGKYASVNSQEELEFLKDLVGNRIAKVGGLLTRSATGVDTFMWFDNSSVDYISRLDVPDAYTQGRYRIFVKSNGLVLNPDQFHTDYAICEFS